MDKSFSQNCSGNQRWYMDKSFSQNCSGNQRWYMDKSFSQNCSGNQRWYMDKSFSQNCSGNQRWYMDKSFSQNCSEVGWNGQAITCNFLKTVQRWDGMDKQLHAIFSELFSGGTDKSFSQNCSEVGGQVIFSEVVQTGHLLQQAV